MFGLVRGFLPCLHTGQSLRLQGRSRGSMLGASNWFSLRRSGLADGLKNRVLERAPRDFFDDALASS
jgi:hypothetical protein